VRTAERIIRLLKARLDFIDQLRGIERFWRSHQYWTWRYETQFWLEQIFGENSQEASDFRQIDWPDRTPDDSRSVLQYAERWFSALGEAEVLLHRLIRQSQGALRAVKPN
jgi:hypothetical protein